MLYECTVNRTLVREVVLDKRLIVNSNLPVKTEKYFVSDDVVYGAHAVDRMLVM